MLQMLNTYVTGTSSHFSVFEKYSLQSVPSEFTLQVVPTSIGQNSDVDVGESIIGE